jgi:hypothetical protein
MTERNRRGRPQKGSKRRRIYICGTALIDRSIMPDEALALVQGLSGNDWTYETLASCLQKPLKDAMQLMNDLLHYGLMKFKGKNGKESVFERSITNCE